MMQPAPIPDDLNRYRQYLILLVRAKLDPRLAGPVDPSDIVQQTLLEAHAREAVFKGETEADRRAWVRRILANNLADTRRGLFRAKRDLRRQRSLEALLDRSSIRLGSLLAADQSSIGSHLDREERAVRLADALMNLPEAQREALIMQYWQGIPLAAIAEQMSRSPAAVAGLLKRGLKQLRQQLGESEGEW